MVCNLGFCLHTTEIAHPGNGINTSQTTTLQANLAIRHRQDVRPPEASSVRSRMDQLRRPAPIAFDFAQAEELGLEDHCRSTRARNAHAPGQLRPERGGRTEGGSLKAVRRLY